MPLWLSIIAILVSASGWVVFFYGLYIDTPKVQGRILDVIIGIPEDKLGTSFRPYIYLINKGKTAVHLIDYQLEIDVGNGYEKTERRCGENKEGMCGRDAEGKEIQFQNIISSQSPPVRQDVPLHGWITFESDKPKEYFAGVVKKYKLRCIDAMGEEHVIQASSKELVDRRLILDLGGIDRLKLK